MVSDLELRILRKLQADGRMTNAALAEAVNLSAASCHRYKQKLLQDGLISSIRAHVRPEAVHLSTLVMVGVVLDQSTQESLSEFEKAICCNELKGVLDCYLVSGEYDYILKIRVRDIEAFNRLHANHLIRLPRVSQLRTFFVLKAVRDNELLPF
ncbi:transcriptional regulator, AsnC family [Pseudovibrio denitrificans]|uniref:Transcriptional regulator, AsnC family n=1 Tax=Pseudovibrio denitrificans TaxID=258256 RepID=A0A1I7DZC4_9HYPH|nr:Lrp/AsnC family transcriptional regulator [Pseudovibrio denitrificans]SFU16995.1 transcriptional regulator, AsnC family [Pseudovibrio denitrificans]